MGRGKEALGSAAEGTTLALFRISGVCREPSPREGPFPDFTDSSGCAGAVQTVATGVEGSRFDAASLHSQGCLLINCFLL